MSVQSSEVKGGFCLLAIVGLLLVTNVAQGQDYKIKLDRPSKVGDEFNNSVTARVTQTNITLQNGEETKRETKNFTAACQGTEKVLEIDPKTGYAKRIRYQVDKMTRDGQELYPAGTVIIARRAGAVTSYDIDGDRPDEENSAVLNALLDVSGGIANQAGASSSDKPQQVGESWAINTGRLSQDIAEGGAPITADELKGESQLVSVKKVDGQDVMIIKSKITAEGFKKDLEGGGSISDGKMTAEVTEVVPVDDTRPGISRNSKTSVTVTINPPFGAKSMVTTKRERKERREPAGN